MSIGLSNIGGSVAGTSLSQLRGSDVDRAQQENNAHELRAQGDQKAELAAGVGQTDGEDHQTAERDADGRQLWRIPSRKGREETDDTPPGQSVSKDASGECGNMLDLSG